MADVDHLAQARRFLEPKMSTNPATGHPGMTHYGSTYERAVLHALIAIAERLPKSITYDFSEGK